ncbi:PGAP1-like protein [Desmospora activa DSM 45169]|uniref:PGAP1-like protein n=2 Tax=Desmospora TaxID=500614 RepID=A0A2T4ZCF6_9BACL|nr:PGAP1-like protein [Desmospora activa DSM 45169]
MTSVSASDVNNLTKEDLAKNPDLIKEFQQKKSEERKKMKQKDSDGDGLTDFYEKWSALNPKSKDTDNNGIPDGQEDTDNDGLTNLEEQKLNTNPSDPDSDGDGINDKDEIEKYGTDPTKKDTDQDGLSDYFEIEVTKTDPLNKDSNNNGILDGDEEREYEIKDNEWGIKGFAIGKGHVPEKYTIRQTPILIMQEADYQLIFDINSTDPSITFDLRIPLKSANNNPILYRYQYRDKNNVGLVEVPNQKINKQEKYLEVEVQGSDTFVVVEKPIFNSSIPKTDNIRKFKHDQLNDNAKVKGLPGVKISADKVSKDGTMKITQKAKHDLPDNKTKDSTYTAEYKVVNIIDEGNEQFAELQPITNQSGLPYVILLHGYGASGISGGTSESIGFTNAWSNSALWNSDPNFAEAERDIAAYETFSGESYNEGEQLSYGQPDVHYITGVSDSENIGPFLTNVPYPDWNPSYTENVDLFIFEYDNDAQDIYLNSYHLQNYIGNMKAMGIIPGNERVKLVAHSMGGLVSRYMIENIDSAHVDELMTIGSPHFGSDLVDWLISDMNRNTSCLWNEPKDGCFPLSGNNSDTEYSLFFAGYINNNLANLSHWVTPLDNRPTGMSYGDWYRDVYFKGDVSGDIDDYIVNVDSAFGSDLEFSNPLPSLDVTQPLLIYGDSKHAGHSEMLKNEDWVQFNIYIYLLT